MESSEATGLDLGALDLAVQLVLHIDARAHPLV